MRYRSAKRKGLWVWVRLIPLLMRYLSNKNIIEDLA